MCTEKKSLAYGIQNTPNFDEPLPLKCFVVHRNFAAVQFLDKLKPLRNDPFKYNNKPTEVTYELSSKDRRTFHTHRNHVFPYNAKELLLFLTLI